MKTLIFKNDGTDFSGINAARGWCHDHRMVVGSMQGPSPMGAHRASEAGWIPKWRNMTPHERELLDGKLTGDKRSGDVTLHLTEIAAREVCPDWPSEGEETT